MIWFAWSANNGQQKFASYSPSTRVPKMLSALFFWFIGRSKKKRKKKKAWNLHDHGHLNAHKAKIWLSLHPKIEKKSLHPITYNCSPLRKVFFEISEKSDDADIKDFDMKFQKNDKITTILFYNQGLFSKISCQNSVKSEISEITSFCSTTKNKRFTHLWILFLK